MLIDARKFANGQRVDADICLIGAGAAGIALARELVKDRERVVLLESGGFEYEPEIQALYAGETTGLRYMPLDAARLRYFGGSTNHFGGASRILDPIDFEARDWLPGSGWPITHQELAPFYTRAQDVFPICPYGFDAERWIHGTGFPQIGADSQRIATKIWQFNPVRFGTVYRDELQSAANVSVCLHATVLGFEAERSGSRVKTLNCATPGGPRFTVASKIFILCCGGIENARVLLIAKEERALSFDRGNILGRYFMDHLVINNAAQFEPLRRGPTPRDLYVPSGLNGHWFRGVLSVREEVAKAEQLQSVAFFIDQQERPTGRAALAEIWTSLARGSLPERPGDAFGRVFGFAGERIDQAYRAAFHSKSGIFNELHAFEPSSIFAFLEQAPNRDSRVSLSEARDSLGQRRVHLDWRLSRSDKRSLLRSLEIVGAELARLGVARIKLNLNSDLDQWPDDLTTYCHHMGTTRMDRAARHGVVDEHCRVHGVDNLYVAGSSVFPTGGSAAPTLTIVALALRLADHLKREAT